MRIFNQAKLKRLYSQYMIVIAVLGQFLYFAQPYKIFTTKSAEDISVIGFTIGLISVASWLIYGIIIKDIPLIIADAIGCIGAIAVLAGAIIYG